MNQDLEDEVEMLLKLDRPSSSQIGHYELNPEFNLGSCEKSLEDEILDLDKEISESFFDDDDEKPLAPPFSTSPVDDISLLCPTDTGEVRGLEPQQPPIAGPNWVDNGQGMSKMADFELVHERASKAMCWNVEYYQPYFYVDTNTVVHRLRSALLPWHWWNLVYVEDVLGNTPDLYGPFWLATTTSFCMAATYSVGVGLSESRGIFILQRTLITFYTTNLVVPASVWVLLKFSPVSKPLVPLLSTFGYAQVVYLPASLFGVFPTAGALQLIFLIPAALLSSLCFIRGVMTSDLKETLVTSSIQIGLSVIAVVLLSELTVVLYIAFALH